MKITYTAFDAIRFNINENLATYGGGQLSIKKLLLVSVIVTQVGCVSLGHEQPVQNATPSENIKVNCSKEILYPTGQKGHGCMGKPYGVGN